MGSVRSKTVIGNPISNEEEFRASNFQMLDNVLKFAKEQMYTNSMRNSEKYPVEERAAARRSRTGPSAEAAPDSPVTHSLHLLKTSLIEDWHN